MMCFLVGRYMSIFVALKKPVSVDIASTPQRKPVDAALALYTGPERASISRVTFAVTMS